MFLNNQYIYKFMKYLSLIVQAIKEKPELNKVDFEFIAEQVIDYINKHQKIIKKLESSISFEKFKLSKEHKLILKTIRAKIRKSYALFQLDSQLRLDYFDRLKKKSQSLTLHRNILETHRSTNERLSIYPILYKDIFQITKQPLSILDLGCGINPFSYPWMKLKDIKYIAVELNLEDLKLIQDYFKLKKINGLILPINLVKDYSKLNEFNVDICFMFKLLDSLENIQKNITKNLIQNINAKYIIASFSTKSVGGKIMKNIRRHWFEYIVKDLGFNFKILEYDNEIFYILTKAGFLV